MSSVLDCARPTGGSWQSLSPYTPGFTHVWGLDEVLGRLTQQAALSKRDLWLQCGVGKCWLSITTQYSPLEKATRRAGVCMRGGLEGCFCQRPDLILHPRKRKLRQQSSVAKVFLLQSSGESKHFVILSVSLLAWGSNELREFLVYLSELQASL